jgi:hypothetical protein
MEPVKHELKTGLEIRRTPSQSRCSTDRALRLAKVAYLFVLKACQPERRPQYPVEHRSAAVCVALARYHIGKKDFPPLLRGHLIEHITSMLWIRLCKLLFQMMLNRLL